MICLMPDTRLQEITEVTVATYSGEAEAQLWASILWEEGIPCVLVPLGPGAGAWGSSAFLPHELRVRSEDAERAQAILSAVE